MKKEKKILSLLLSIIMMATILPTTAITAFADSPRANAEITVEDVTAIPGSTVDVKVTISKNPGILGAIFSLSYDDGLTLTNVTEGDVFSSLSLTKPGKFKSPCQFTWDGMEIDEHDLRDGTIITFTFAVSKDVKAGDKCNINLSCNEGDFVDGNLNPVNITFNNAKVSVIDYTPGDVNGDKNVNTMDVILIRRFLAGGYDVTINNDAADVNADTNINTIDIILIRRFIAGGYGVVLIPGATTHKHMLESVEKVDATCTANGNIAYWHCTSCDKYYSDVNCVNQITLNDTIINATGHTIVVDQAVPATYDNTGLTEGSHCSVCGTVFKEQTEIPKLQKEEYNITYHISSNDAYLSQQDINNPNPNTYSSQDGLRLSNLSVDGYTFEGWYDGEGANGELIKTIPSGTKGDFDLYAKWTLKEYTITFDSPDVPMNSIKYTVDKGASLTNAKWYGYTFVGWSNDDGFLVSRIKPGTTGNMTLHANWTSNRNRATSYSSYGSPTIIEDDVNGQFMFIYDIGQIDNVPLNQIEYIGNSDGISIDREYQVTNTITEDSAETIADTISNATTRSSAWTLSEEWNKIYEAEEESGEVYGKTKTRTDSTGSVTGGNYYVSNSSGGSSFISTNSGGSNTTSSKITTDNSTGINGSYDHSTEKYVDTKLGAKYEKSAGASLKIPLEGADLGVSAKNTLTLSGEVSSGRRDTDSYHVGYEASASVGTERAGSSSTHYDVTAQQGSNWNSTSGYEKSYQQSRSTEVSDTVSEQISKRTSYKMTDSLKGGNSSTESVGGTDTRSNEYSTTLKYSKGDATTTTQNINYRSNEAGYYRLVNAGTVHVFGVVCYDAATNSYYTYTYNVLDDERHTYLDYSKDNALFNDCENGVVAFEIPFEVCEYVAGMTAKTEGLEFSLAGKVNGYEPEEVHETVTIPQYYSAKNGADGTYSAVKVTSFDSNTFKGNTDIKTIVLPVYVDTIPDNAFEGCISLESVIALGVKDIGENAFKGCTSLKTFMSYNKVTHLGNNAFENVNEIKVMAANEQVLDAAINSGAKKVTVEISKVTDNLDNKKIVVSDKDYFALLSDGKSYKNMKLHSTADETYVSNMMFTNNDDTPLRLNSSKVTLNRVVVESAPGFALILENPSTEVALYGTVELGSVSENAILSRNITLKKENSEVSGIVNSYGDVLVCGTVTNDAMLNVVDGDNNTYEQISEASFERFLTSSQISFNANGGDMEATSKIVYYGQRYGEMPTPTRQYYTFDGWYTDKTGGTKITADTVVDKLSNQEFFAHWSPNEIKITFSIASDATISQEYKIIHYGESVGELPVPTRDYYTFTSWYIKTGTTAFEQLVGKNINASYTPDSDEEFTVYARWTSNTLSDWVTESEVPEDAKVINTKWTYDEQEYTTNSSSSLAGWTKYDTRITSYGSEQGPVYSDPSGNGRKTRAESYIASYTHHWKYYHRHIGTGKIGTDSTAPKSDRHTIDLTYALSQYTGYNSPTYGYPYGYVYCSDVGTDHLWLYDGEYDSANYGTRWYYQDPVYTYYFTRKVAKESTTEVTAGGNISNVKKLVQYRNK